MTGVQTCALPIYAAEEDPSVILGNVRVNSVPATILFDSGASHTFISAAFANLHGIDFEKLPTPLGVHSPGSSWHTSRVSHGNMIEIGFLWFPTSFLILNSNDIDVIVGMNWLSQSSKRKDTSGLASSNEMFFFSIRACSGCSA